MRRATSFWSIPDTWVTVSGRRDRRSALAEIDLAALVANAAAPRHDGRPVVEGIGQVVQAALERRGRGVVARRRGHGEGVVRPVVVVAAYERIEAHLLLEHVGRRAASSGRSICSARATPPSAAVPTLAPSLGRFELWVDNSRIQSITSIRARCPGALASGPSQVTIGASIASARATYMASYALMLSRSFHARPSRSRCA